MMKLLSTTVLPLLLALPMAAQAAPSGSDIGKEISRDLAEARVEMRAELAKARQELQSENLELGNNLTFAGRADAQEKHPDLPPPEHPPQGHLLNNGKAPHV